MRQFDDFNKEIDEIKFSEEEKKSLAERLRTAAEAENAGKKPKRFYKRGIIAAAAAVAVMSVTAAAVGISGQNIKKYFGGSSEASELMLDKGTYQINRSETYNGWTVSLTDCAGDDSNLYIGIDVTAPEGTVLENYERYYHFDDYDISFGLFDDIRSSWGVREVEDEDPTDNKLSFVFEIVTHEPVQGKTADIMLSDFIDWWWEDRYTENAVQHEGSELTEAVRGHKFKFKDVRLDYTNQTIRLEPNVPVEIFSGEATLTKLEISPISVTARIVGGSCDDHHNKAASRPELVAETWGEEYTPDGTRRNDFCDLDLTIEFVMKDGSVYDYRHGHGSCEDDPNAEGGTYIEMTRSYSKLIDISQIEYVVVCGTEVDIN